LRRNILPGTVKPVLVSLVEPVAYPTQLATEAGNGKISVTVPIAPDGRSGAQA
jgi:hypothetical protein